MAQSYANHTRWSPVYHFFVSPVVGLYALYMLWAAIRSPSLATVADALVALAIYAGLIMARVFALTVQNRLVRLEERLRLERLLPADRLAASHKLSTRQLIALRFAADGEVPGLVDRILAGELGEPKAIKQAVREWRPDYLRV
ncbi:MAG: DUF6526 family protein [Gemmatimonadales bacterium]